MSVTIPGFLANSPIGGIQNARTYCALVNDVQGNKFGKEKGD